jgi:hypothetical protein
MVSNVETESETKALAPRQDSFCGQRIRRLLSAVPDPGASEYECIFVCSHKAGRDRGLFAVDDCLIGIAPEKIAVHHKIQLHGTGETSQVDIFCC